MTARQDNPADAVKREVHLIDYLSDMDIPIRGNRAVATWRGGEKYNVAIDESKGVWYDHVEGRGGTVIDACMEIEGLPNPADAIRALSTRYGVNAKAGHGNRPRCRPQPATAAKPVTVPDFVRRMIQDGGGTATFADIRARSVQPLTGWEKMDGATAIWLASLFDDSDFMHIFDKRQMVANPRKARLGHDFRTVADFLKLNPQELDALGDCTSRNPFTGRFCDASKSYTVKDCLARCRYALVEFDALDLDRQCAFWVGFLKDPARAVSVASITYSGNKSLHGLLEAPSNLGWADWTANLKALLCSDPTDAYTRTNADGKQETVYPFRCDPKGLAPHGNTRLAGGRRGDNGKRQELLYLAGTY